MEAYKREFIEFLEGAGVLKFGDFTAKSGRKIPYLNHLFIVYKLSVKLLKPAENKLTLGKTVQAFSEAVKGITDGQGLIIQTVEKNAQAASEAVYNVEQNLLSSIQASEENIKSTVAENYYLKDETDALVSSVSTEIEQTKNSVEIQFTQFSQHHLRSGGRSCCRGIRTYHRSACASSARRLSCYRYTGIR